MFEASAWEGLRDACEDALSEHVLWLDLHRWSAVALERLGPPFAVAREAVGRETAALVARIPGLPSLFFSNGTPFASPETADWLAGEGARFGGSGGGRAASSADEATTTLLSDAEARVTAGQIDEGLAMAIDLANNAASASARFRAQLLAAKIAHRVGKGDLALALLERLLPQVDATLEAWEPSVCADYYETALKVVRAVSPDWGDRQTLLFRRLLQVDPAAALRIG
jgi:type VI secretion system protein VasJ